MGRHWRRADPGLRKKSKVLKRPNRPSAAPRASAEHAGPSEEAKKVALLAAQAGLDKKASEIEIIDVTGKVDYADFLVVMTGRSDRHVHAIATGIEEAMRRKKIAPMSMEGLSAATWVLIDFGDVVVHVFQEEARLLYDIEGLWIDAGRVPVPAEGKGATGAAVPPAAKAPPPEAL
jgi:ribosome-associated protein